MSRAAIITIAAIAAAIIAAVIIAVVIHNKNAADKKNSYQPLVCEEPVFPETLPAENGGVYVRKLSTYWWVSDVKNGRVIIEDVNSYHGGLVPDNDQGVVSLTGGDVIPCVYNDVYFTANGYIAATNVTVVNYFNMGGNGVAKYDIDSVPPEAKEKYEGEGSFAERAYVPLADETVGHVEYYGKYISVSESESHDQNTKMNTCIYVLTDGGEKE